MTSACQAAWEVVMFCIVSLRVVLDPVPPQEWKEGDDEDEEWHEDTFEWKEKERGKAPKGFDPNDPNQLLQQAMSNQGMQVRATWRASDLPTALRVPPKRALHGLRYVYSVVLVFSGSILSATLSCAADDLHLLEGEHQRGHATN